MNRTKTQKQRQQPVTAGTSTATNETEFIADIPAEQQQNYAPSHEETSALAQRIYEDEGCPEGCAEEHWYEAERRLRLRAGNANSEQERTKHDRLAIA